jgi:hypothetical protein
MTKLSLGTDRSDSADRLPQWLDAGEALVRIAFPMPASDRASALEMRDRRIWRVPLDPLLAALKAQAEGREYSAPPDEWLTTDEIRDEARRLMRETGKTAAELSAIVERVAKLDARTVNLGDPEIALAVGRAADDLRAGAHERRITARGRRAAGALREAIPAEQFDEEREIDPFGTLKGPGGKVEWTDVEFCTAEVLREWPEGCDPATGAAPAGEGPQQRAAEPPAPSERARGGRPPTYDWDAMTREAVRVANLDGFETRAALAKHLRDWVATNWQEQPDERTLRREIAKRCPSDLPER